MSILSPRFYWTPSDWAVHFQNCRLLEIWLFFSNLVMSIESYGLNGYFAIKYDRGSTRCCFYLSGEIFQCLVGSYTRATELALKFMVHRWYILITLADPLLCNQQRILVRNEWLWFNERRFPWNSCKNSCFQQDDSLTLIRWWFVICCHNDIDILVIYSDNYWWVKF